MNLSTVKMAGPSMDSIAKTSLFEVTKTAGLYSTSTAGKSAKTIGVHATKMHRPPHWPCFSCLIELLSISRFSSSWASPGRKAILGAVTHLDCSKPTPWREMQASDRVPRPARLMLQSALFASESGEYSKHGVYQHVDGPSRHGLARAP